MQRKFVLAILFVAPAALFHASYLFLGGIVTLLILFQSNFGKKSLLASGILLLLVLPYSYHIFSHFIQLDDGLKKAISTAVMAGFQDNIHINPNNWLNAKFYLQLVIIALGSVLLWKTRLRTILVGTITFGLLLTMLAYSLNNATLISLNPWRISVLIMPIASAAVASRIVASGIWTIIRPHILSFIGVACVALVWYRIFGNNSANFMTTWTAIQAAAFIIVSISAGFVFRNETLNKLLAPLIIIAIITTGVVDKYVDSLSRTNRDEFKAILAINKNEEPSTIYIIPPSWTSFRMNAKKAVFADQNLIYGPALPGLMNRLKMLETAYDNQDFSAVVNSIPAGTTVKLIASPTTQTPAFISKEELTNNFACFTLQQ